MSLTSAPEWRRSGAIWQFAQPREPTLVEAGRRDFEAMAWYALLAPARTPSALDDYIRAEAEKRGRVVRAAGIRIDPP